MRPKVRKTTEPEAAAPHDGTTRAPDAPLDPGAADSFWDAQPAGFRDHPRSAIEAAVVDPDVQDSEGGE